MNIIDRAYKPGIKEITIGRQKRSTIYFPSSSLSRKQCNSIEILGKFVYEDNKWMIMDGDGQKGSTNGTWLFAKDFIDIENGMIIKAAQIRFEAKLIDNA